VRENGEHFRQFINYIEQLTYAGTPAKIFGRRETIQKVPDISMYRLNMGGAFDRSGRKCHSEEWTEDERPMAMRESLGEFTRLLSVNPYPMPVFVELVTYRRHKLFR
jgi:hypothetical protein